MAHVDPQWLAEPVLQLILADWQIGRSIAENRAGGGPAMHGFDWER